MEAKNSKHLKNMAASQLCNNNPILRLHYRSEAELENSSLPESERTSSSKTFECKFCYSKSPKLVLKASFKQRKILNKQNDKSVFVRCRVCNNKFPNKYQTKLQARIKSDLNKNEDKHSVRHNIDNDCTLESKGKSKKKRNKDINAGLTLPPSGTTTSSLKYSEKSENSVHQQGRNCNKSDKLLKLLLKNSETVDASQSSSNKLQMFLQNA